jgi:hypothetical protein
MIRMYECKKPVHMLMMLELDDPAMPDHATLLSILPLTWSPTDLS